MKVHFKKILVISDNLLLCQRFSDLIKKKAIKTCSFTFAISPFSDKEKFNIDDSVKALVLDLKKPEDVTFIKSNFDLVFSIHCKQIFPLYLIENVKCINVHPGYNPINRGWYPQVFSIINKYPVGATIHEIDSQLDHGNIIAREFVEQFSHDTSETLYNRIIEKEMQLLEENLEAIVFSTYTAFKPEDEGNLFLKKDYNDILQLDLNEVTTVGNFIDKLRALTHGEYKNAYFIDNDTGKKVFIGIQLKPQNNE